MVSDRPASHSSRVCLLRQQLFLTQDHVKLMVRLVPPAGHVDIRPHSAFAPSLPGGKKEKPLPLGGEGCQRRSLGKSQILSRIPAAAADAPDCHHESGRTILICGAVMDMSAPAIPGNIAIEVEIPHQCFSCGGGLNLLISPVL
jgi:hypothetical protein